MEKKVITISIPKEIVIRAQSFCGKTARKLSPFIGLCVQEKLDVLEKETKFISADKKVSNGKGISDSSPSNNN